MDANAHRVRGRAGRIASFLGQEPKMTDKKLINFKNFSRVYEIGRSKTYQLVNSGELETVHVGRRHLIVVASAERMVERLRQQVA